MSKELENLKELEMWATNGYTACEVEKAKELVKPIEKKLKAFEFIKNGYADFEIGYDKEHDYWELFIELEDMKYVLASGEGKEEYELLKETLL